MEVAPATQQGDLGYSASVDVVSQQPRAGSMSGGESGHRCHGRNRRH